MILRVATTYNGGNGMGRLLVNVLLDRSGSMSALVAEVISHYNGYVDDLRTLDQEVLLSLIQFDDRYEEIYVNQPLDKVVPLTTDTYNSRGMTAYFDALARTIKAVDAIKEAGDKVILVVNTDGFENASRIFTGSQVKELVESHDSDDYQIVFIGAGIDALEEGGAIGIRSYNTLAVSSTPRGIGYSYDNLSHSTIAYATGAAATMDFASSVAELGTEEEWSKKKTNKKTSKTPTQVSDAK